MRYFLIKKDRFGIPITVNSKEKGFWLNDKRIKSGLSTNQIISDTSAHKEVTRKEFNDFLIKHKHELFNLRTPIKGE